MKSRITLASAGFAMLLNVAASPAGAVSFEKDIRPLLEQHCFDCHGDEAKPKGGVNLERFKTDDDVMRDRSVWASVFEKIELHQMPPPKRETQPSPPQREQVLAWVSEIAARPDPALGARDPGRPALRRLTRLEYNNAVRDLFALDEDVFMFPERLPLSDKSYFQPAVGKMPDSLRVPLREYGGKYPVLCRQLGLPGDNRAEHGFRNRGDAMNFSPLLLEQYLAAAREIVSAPELTLRSAIAASLFGERGLKTAFDFKPKAQRGDLTVDAAGVFAPGAKAWKMADGSADNDPKRFFDEVRDGFANGVSGVFDSGDMGSGTTTVPGKGAVLRVAYAGGAKTLTVNPNEDLWLAGFATAQATSGGKIFTNQEKEKKVFELTFKIEGGDEDEGITRLGVFVVGRSGQSGSVELRAKFTDDTETALTAEVAEGDAGTTLFTFAAVPGEHVKSLIVVGTNFSGPYVLLDDLGFITSGKPKPVNASTHPVATPQALSPRVAAPRMRLAEFLARAFRRAVTDEEVDRFFALFESAKRTGKSEPDAMRSAFAAALASPAFLFVEANGVAGAGKVATLTDSELATRLSLFLWSSIPDDELLALANSGRLHEPATLVAQTQRMLRHPKARELSESFAVQWLRLDQLYTSKPDRDLFKRYYSGPQGKSTLHGAALVEALLLFETVLVEDRSVLDFIAADYTWLDASLAKLYGIQRESEADEPAPPMNTTREIKKSDAGLWRRARLSDKSRGGFLTMSAPLTVTSLPFRTSPVKRGAWLLETVFNRPPTEPKVAFAVENDTKEAAQQMSIRQRFEAHRSKAACYSCHVRLDPPGFALERFDAVGAWRDTDAGAQVDARGEWNQRPFNGPAEYKAILAQSPHEFVRGFIEHLLSYAIGRKLEVFDMPAVDEIERTARNEGYKFSAIVRGIVTAYPFTHVRSAAN